VQLLSLQRQGELLLGRQASLAAEVAAAAERLEALTTQRAAAAYDVEVQLRLKQGQVRVVALVCACGGQWVKQQHGLAFA
jgi:hypothetical protein